MTEVDELVKTLESGSNHALTLRTVHNGRISTKPAKLVKTDSPRIGDVVGEMDNSGVWAETYTVTRKPAQYTTVQSSRTGITQLLITNKMTRIGPNEWKYVR
jgi:hypothetical protein